MNQVAFASLLLLCFGGFSLQSVLKGQELSKPNVMIVLADDMGYSDVGCYGGEIHTPNLDALAENGVKFTQFYNTARCWPTRASLLTGYYAQQVHRDGFSKDDGGSQGKRPKWAPLLPELLKSAGYTSFHSGKWHLDGEPRKTGFDKTYTLLDDNRHFAPNRHQLNGEDLPQIQRGEGYYATHAITDYMLRFLAEHNATTPDQPFFAYVAYTAPHFPLHAPQSTIAKYKDQYAKGWDVTRRERQIKQANLGLPAYQTTDYEPHIGPPYAFPKALQTLGPSEVDRELPWNELTESQKAFQAAKMATHAAMVDEVDAQIGRLVEWLRQVNKLDNTIVMFLSDNGASAEIMIRGDGHDVNAVPGSADSYLCLGPGWSRCSNSPFRRHKTWVHEGGISTPLIVHWPNGIKQSGYRQQVGHVACVVPTILDAIGMKIEADIEGPENYSGISLLQAITINAADNTQQLIWWLHEDNKAIRRDDFKAVKSANENWQLYDLSKDRVESMDLASERPELLQELVQQWMDMTNQFQLDASTEPK